jgi:hypothetical protein
MHAVRTYILLRRLKRIIPVDVKKDDQSMKKVMI